MPNLARTKIRSARGGARARRLANLHPSSAPRLAPLAARRRPPYRRPHLGAGAPGRPWRANCFECAAARPLHQSWACSRRARRTHPFDPGPIPGPGPIALEPIILKLDIFSRRRSIRRRTRNNCATRLSRLARPRRPLILAPGRRILWRHRSGAQVGAPAREPAGARPIGVCPIGVRPIGVCPIGVCLIGARPTLT